MVNVNEFQILISSSDWELLNDELGDNISRLAFERPQDKYTLLEMFDGKMSVEHWKNEFNLKLLNIEINYSYMYMYYNKMDGYDIYQEKRQDLIAYHFWFSYEAESLLSRLFTLVDNLYHILNIKYNLNVSEKLGFIKEVTRELSKINSNLSGFLTGLKDDDRYKSAQKIRNDFTHNHSPLNMTSGFKRNANGAELSKGSYMKPVEILRCIDDFIIFLEDMTNEIKKYV